MVAGLNWLSCLFVLPFCNVFQLSFLFLYSCIYFLMILSLATSAKKTLNQRWQSIVSPFPARGAGEDFAFHTLFTASGCNSPRFRQCPPPEAAVGSWELEIPRKYWGEKCFLKTHHFGNISGTAEMKPFVQYEYSLSNQTLQYIPIRSVY